MPTSVGVPAPSMLFAEQEAALLEGLDRIHAAGVLRGDVNPRNVVLPHAGSNSGRPLWIDFECATLSSSPVREGSSGAVSVP